jgi:hypothetical protein
MFFVMLYIRHLLCVRGPLRGKHAAILMTTAAITPLLRSTSGGPVDLPKHQPRTTLGFPTAGAQLI